MEKSNIAGKIEKQLSPEVMTLIKRLAALAEKRGIALYLVGGPVRDLLLGREIFDIDLVAEGDAPSLARELAVEAGGSVRVHDRFGTATYFTDDISIDIVTARSETYPQPGALPVVKPGTIKEDLYRRDFTINAMAVRLNPAYYGELLDPYNGQLDRQKCLVRIIHDKSFRDDATRILRALRYEQRLGFKLEEETEKLLRRDVSYLNTISGDRIRNELELFLQEERPENIWQRAAELGVLPHIHQALPWNRDLYARFERVLSIPENQVGVALYFALLAYEMSEKDNEEVIAYLKLPRTIAQAMRHTVRLKLQLTELEQPKLARSKVYQILQNFTPAALQAVDISVKSPVVQQYIQLFFTRLRYIKTELDGKALSEMGVKAGPGMGKMLETLKEARMDDKITTKEEEIKLVKQLLEENKTG